jgi:hypothetical protein
LRDGAAKDACVAKLHADHCDRFAGGFDDESTLRSCFTGAPYCQCNKLNPTYCFPGELDINRHPNRCPTILLPTADAYMMLAPDVTTALGFASSYRGFAGQDEEEPATSLFREWSTRHLHWSDVSSSKTTPAKVFKDTTSEFGKPYCGRGYIVQLSKTNYSDYFEALISAGSDIVHLSAVGDTGELVQGMDGGFCGIVTGTYTYSNTGGGTTHAIDVVGMFDLPSNRKIGAASANAETSRTTHSPAGYCFLGNSTDGDPRRYCSPDLDGCRQLSSVRDHSGTCLPVQDLPCEPAGVFNFCDAAP